MQLRAVDRISIALRERQTIGIVGESGSGKSTLGPRGSFASCRARDRSCSATGTSPPPTREKMRPLRKELQLVFQDPFGSLSPA